jgi:hypothetical protein
MCFVFAAVLQPQLDWHTNTSVTLASNANLYFATGQEWNGTTVSVPKFQLKFSFMFWYLHIFEIGPFVKGEACAT